MTTYVSAGGFKNRVGIKETAMWNMHLASNMNFPAPLAALGFLAACGGTVLSLGAAAVAAFIGKPRFARWMLMGIGAGAISYTGMLAGFSLASRPRMLARGQEKYFCEIDCHLAYSVVDVKAEPGTESWRYVITLRTRFDQTTISPSRPKDAPLVPSPREVRLVDGQGREFAPVDVSGVPLFTPLKPADSYATQIQFEAPQNASQLRLLLRSAPQWPNHFVIGDENSLWHKKTYFAL
jgi:hypothetical protein